MSQATATIIRRGLLYLASSWLSDDPWRLLVIKLCEVFFYSGPTFSIKYPRTKSTFWKNPLFKAIASARVVYHWWLGIFIYIFICVLWERLCVCDLEKVHSDWSIMGTVHQCSSVEDERSSQDLATNRDDIAKDVARKQKQITEHVCNGTKCIW